MLLNRVWDSEENFADGETVLEKKFAENDTPKPCLAARKRKFKARLRESAVQAPRQVIPINESETDLCFSLWRSVIIQALYDISGHGGNSERRLIRAESLSWFASTSREQGESDFEYVCQMANLKPSSILAIVTAVREKGLEIREGFNFRSARKESSARQGRKNHKNSKKED